MHILLADDHAILRQGLNALLEDIEGYQVVGEAQNGQEAINLAEKLKPDLVIMDIAMPELDGLAAAEVIKKKFPEIKIIILSMYSDAYYIRQAFSAGASGFLLKETAFDELKMVLEFIKNDKIYISSSLMPLVIDSFVDSMPDEEKVEKYKKLTAREKEILQLMIKGAKRNEIADKLFISLKTVDHHKKNIKDKLKAGSDLELNDYANLGDIVED